MQILSVYCLIIGKFLNGFFVTVVQITQIKMINETVPVYLLDKYGPMINVLDALGYLLVTSFGKGLPSGDYNPILGDTPSNLKALNDNKND